MSFAAIVSALQHTAQRLARLLAAVAALLAAPAIATAQAASQVLPLDARAKGSPTAPVTVYEMADFQCPYCRNFFKDTFGALDSEYVKTGKVRWIFINFPIVSAHANAEAAAEFAVCAALQGKFWPTHNLLYESQEQWEKIKDPAPYFQSKIAALGLRADVMNGCLQSGRAAAMVKDDAAGAQRSGVTATPSFYIEGGIMEGAQPLPVFRHILDSVYAAKKKAR